MVIVLEKELAALSMRPGDDVKPVLDKIKDTYARMAAAGSNVSQMQQCTKIISWLRQQILQEDFRRRHTGGGAANKTAEGYGAAGGSRGRGGGRGRGRGRGFGIGRGRGDYNEGHGSSGGRGSTRMEGACWYCKKAGHPWFKCFSRPEGWAPPGMKPPSGERARGGTVQGSGAQGSVAQGKANPGMFLMVENVKRSEGDVGSVGKVVMHPLTHWVIDSGCTSHMTPRADLLDEVKPPGKIKFMAAASGALLPVIGVRNAKVMGANGGLVGLGNVLLVEGLSANLLSVRRLQKSKAKVTFGPTSCRAKLGKLLLWDLEEKSSCIKDLWQLPIIPWNGKPPATAAAAATAKTTAGGEETAPTDGALDAVKKVQQSQLPHGEVLACVDATAAWAKASSANGDADWETWHERLCHINIPMLQKLVKDGSLKGLEVKGAAKEIGSCPTCLETKFTKFPFSSGTGPAKAPLALVHMDVVGPTRAPSLSGSRYFLTIVDDHTRAVWVYPLKTKGEVKRRGKWRLGKFEAQSEPGPAAPGSRVPAAPPAAPAPAPPPAVPAPPEAPVAPLAPPAAPAPAAPPAAPAPAPPPAAPSPPVVPVAPPAPPAPAAPPTAPAPAPPPAAPAPPVAQVAPPEPPAAPAPAPPPVAPAPAATRQRREYHLL
ncbi:unnamed protein product [Closterium sp. NIES-53]